MRIKEVIVKLQAIVDRLSVNDIDNNPSLRMCIYGCKSIQDVDDIDELSTAVVVCKSLCTCPKEETNA